MERVEQAPRTYDELYVSGGHDEIYHLPYWKSQYYPMYKQLLRDLNRLRAASVLEVGCGNGAFAHLCKDRARFKYAGFDFSPVAIEMAASRCGKANNLFVADATDSASYKHDFDSIVCSEVLEHLPNDLDVVAAWPKGTKCVCSVPNFDSKYHERFFRCAEDVHNRYGQFIDIGDVTEVFVPLLSDLSPRNKTRAVISNALHPVRVLAILGWPQLVTQRRWFVFSGTKN